ncbi:MAG: H-NS histone family protein [Hyphomicrobiaceae bacterium]|nr:H-NS histone family protein [Hyphomicrobiaceae bacterium]
MAKLNGLEKLSYAELIELRDRVDAAMVAAKAAEKAALKAKMEAMAAESGFSIGELLGGRRGRKSAGPAVVKFRNPKDPSQTWSGRGRKPNWLAEAETAGKKLESFRV